MNFKKKTYANDIKMDAAQCATFLSSKLGHSTKRGVKLLGHKHRSNFHHNQITPLSEGIWVFLWFLSVLVSHSKNLVSAESKLPIWVTIHQELWKLCLCKFLSLDVKRSTFMAKRFQASFSYSTLFDTYPEPKFIWHNRFPFPPTEANYKQLEFLSYKDM